MSEASPQSWLDAVYRLAARLNDVAAAPVKRVRVQAGETSVEVEWAEDTGNGSLPLGFSAPGPAQTAASQEHPGTFTICAPMVGTFYRSPQPGAPPYVDVGDAVEVGQQIAILEAMKLMNAVEAERPGRVVDILVGNAASVEYGQPLFRLTAVGEG